MYTGHDVFYHKTQIQSQKNYCHPVSVSFLCCDFYCRHHLFPGLSVPYTGFCIYNISSCYPYDLQTCKSTARIGCIYPCDTDFIFPVRYRHRHADKYCNPWFGILRLPAPSNGLPAHYFIGICFYTAPVFTAYRYHAKRLGHPFSDSMLSDCTCSRNCRLSDALHK